MNGVWSASFVVCVLGALSVVATRQSLIDQVFWRGQDFREYGLYVCRFYKDHQWR